MSAFSFALTYPFEFQANSKQLRHYYEKYEVSGNDPQAACSNISSGISTDA